MGPSLAGSRRGPTRRHPSLSHQAYDARSSKPQVPNSMLAVNFASHALRVVIRRNGGAEAMARWLGVEAIPAHQVDAERTEEVAQLRREGYLGGRGAWEGVVPVVVVCVSPVPFPVKAYRAELVQSRVTF